MVVCLYQRAFLSASVKIWDLQMHKDIYNCRRVVIHDLQRAERASGHTWIRGMSWTQSRAPKSWEMLSFVEMLCGWQSLAVRHRQFRLFQNLPIVLEFLLAQIILFIYYYISFRLHMQFGCFHCDKSGCVSETVLSVYDLWLFSVHRQYNHALLLLERSKLCLWIPEEKTHRQFNTFLLTQHDNKSVQTLQ